MSKFLNLFGNKSSAAKNTPTKNTYVSAVEGRLETDALPVDDADAINSNVNGYQIQAPSSTTTTPSASADMTADVVRELSDPNYNSMREVVPAAGGVLSALPNGSDNNNAVTSNTMNVHNAQQQLVMQFSNVNQLHFGSVYNFNSNLTANSSRKSSTVDEAAAAAVINGAAIVGGAVAEPTKRQTPRKTTSVVAMMQSQEEPDHRMLDTVATHLGEGWKLVMRNLGHSEGQIEQAIIDHQMHGGIKEVIYQLLLQWLRNADDGEATISRLTTLLWEMQHRECVQRMKLVFKSNTQRKTSR